MNILKLNPLEPRDDALGGVDVGGRGLRVDVLKLLGVDLLTAVQLLVLAFQHINLCLELLDAPLERRTFRLVFLSNGNPTKTVDCCIRVHSAAR